MKKVVILYAPALHEGYVRFFKKHADADFFLISDEIRAEITKEIPYYGRDIRAISSVEMLKALSGLGFKVKEIDIKEIQNSKAEVIMPDEDISHEIHTKFFPDNKVTFESVFLRWDRKISTTEFEVKPDRVISENDFDKEMVRTAVAEGQKSSDWWRMVGALAVKNGKILFSNHNTHMPRPDNPNVLGDPRSNFNAGEAQGVFTSIHAEASIIAEAARKGEALEGVHLYVSTFPCPNCARLIVRSGIKKIFYTSGYSLVDAEDILKIGGVEIVQVKL